MFVKWSCGCKGLMVDDKCWVINSCDKDLSDETLGIYERDIRETFEPLPYNEVRLILIEMGHLMSDGYAFRQVQSLVGHTWPSIKEESAAGGAPIA